MADLPIIAVQVGITLLLCASSFFLGEIRQLKKTIEVLEGHLEWLRSVSEELGYLDPAPSHEKEK